MKIFVRVVIKSSKTNFLVMCNNSHSGCWNFPGGKVDTGEPPEQAAIREVYEETGILINDLLLIEKGVFKIFDEFWYGFIYYAKKAEGFFINKEKEKCVEMKFTGIEEIRHLPSIPGLLHEIISKKCVISMKPVKYSKTRIHESNYRLLRKTQEE